MLIRCNSKTRPARSAGRARRVKGHQRFFSAGAARPATILTLMKPALVSILLAVLFPLSAAAQNNCGASVPTLAPRGTTIFTPEQESILGDVIIDQMRLGFRQYPQTDLTEPLDRIASRLQRYLPAAAYRFQFAVV